jgi:MATE family, multidrug efflux pump
MGEGEERDVGALRRFWLGEGGGREVLAVAYPLVLSHLSFTLQTFVDRLFLTWYSPEALAGAVAGLLVAWSVIALFTATGEYLTTFVAQYVGAGRPRRVGPAIWQGIYFSFAAGALAACLTPALPGLFAWAGHAPAVRETEVAYAGMLMLGAFPIVLMATLSSFFAGRGQTLVVLQVNLLATVANVVLDALWIFGRAGFPRAGATGAALATVVSQLLGALVYLALILRPSMREAYATLSGFRFDPDLARRLLRYGLPSGLQVSLELAAFSAFLLIVGRIGTLELAATSIAFNLNGLVFMPMYGLGIGVSSLVGRQIGAGRASVAERTTWSGFKLALGYMSLCGALYVLAPALLLAPYAAGADPASFPALAAITTVLLRFVAVYSIFDMMNLIFASGLRGAGDTTYALGATVVVALLAMLGPAYLACVVRGAGVYAAWTCASAYVVCLGLLLLRRFRAGAWKRLSVIERAGSAKDGAPVSA